MFRETLNQLIQQSGTNILAGIIMAAVISFFQPWLGLVAFLVVGTLTYRAYAQKKEQSSQLKEYLENINEDFDELTKTAVFGMPFPTAVLEDDGTLLWHNNQFKQFVSVDESILGENIRVHMPEADLAQLRQKTSEPFVVEKGGRFYRFFHNYSTSKHGRNLILLYGFDDTPTRKLELAYEEEKTAIMLLYLDNYEEVRSATDESDRPLVFAEIDRVLTTHATNHNIMLRKYDNDKYVAVLTHKELEELKESKFRIMDQVRDVKKGNRLPQTLSIGVGADSASMLELYDNARTALDIALGRGGDQVVIKVGDTMEYFGGKAQATAKRSKVKARVIAHALLNMIDEASEVFIMGHRNPDMDSFGACLGIYEMVQKKKGRPYIVLAEVTPAIRNVYKKATEELPELADVIIKPEEAEQRVRASSLVVVVDNDRTESTEAPAILAETRKVVVIDHHRRGKDYIRSAALSYVEPYASSASELVTELLTYMEDKVEIRRVIAEALLAGITVDTKNFFYQTGVRTFEAAAVLKRQGADSIVVKQLFKDDYELVKYKSEVVANAKLYHHNIIIGHFDHEMEGSTLVASQAADELLTIQGVNASFVLTRAKGRTHISARSLGAISVQLIMERLGGGGHLTAAATQLDCNEKEALELLKKAIDEYIEEDEDEGNTA